MSSAGCFNSEGEGERARESRREHAHPSRAEKIHTGLSVCQSDLNSLTSSLRSSTASTLSEQICCFSLHPHKWASSLLCPPPHILKFLAEMRSVKTGSMYFYWFPQTMTTSPEKQCQETINVRETAVNILRSINLSGTPGDCSLKRQVAS